MGDETITGPVPDHTTMQPADTSSSSSYWNGLDGLRGVAVLLVMLLHLELFDAWSLRNGALGVHLFFVLSGFLITVLLVKEKRRTGGIALAGFARRRLLRLVPVLAVFSVTLILLGAVRSRLDLGDSVATALYSLTFTSNVFTISGEVPLVTWLAPGGTGIVKDASHLWSLTIEAQFYLLWAVALWLFTRWSWPLRRVALVAGVVVAAVVVYRIVELADGRPPMHLYFDTWSRLDAPMVGALAGLAFVAGWTARVPTRLLTVLAPLGGIGFLVAAAVVEPWADLLPYGLYTVLAVLAAVVIVAVVEQERGLLARGLARSPLVGLGRISYSLYVWHYGVFMVVGRRGDSWPVGVRLMVAFGLAIGLSWLSYRYIEQPFLRRKANAPRRVVPAGGC